MKPDTDPVIDAVRRHRAAPDPAVEDMWRHVRASVPRGGARRRHHNILTIAAGIAAMVLLIIMWPGDDPRPPAAPAVEDSRRIELDAGWSRMPERTARALRTSLFELDKAISDLDVLLRSDPSNQTVKEMRARFNRQRNAWLDSALQDVRPSGV